MPAAAPPVATAPPLEPPNTAASPPDPALVTAPPRVERTWRSDPQASAKPATAKTRRNAFGISVRVRVMRIAFKIGPRTAPNGSKKESAYEPKGHADGPNVVRDVYLAKVRALQV